MVFEHFRFGKILMALRSRCGVASSPDLIETILENLLKYNVFGNVYFQSTLNQLSKWISVFILFLAIFLDLVHNAKEIKGGVETCVS